MIRAMKLSTLAVKMKKILRATYKQNPSRIIGIVAHDLLNKSSPDEFFHDFLEVPFEEGRAYKYNCFKFILANPEQFAGQLGSHLPGKWLHYCGW